MFFRLTGGDDDRLETGTQAKNGKNQRTDATMTVAPETRVKKGWPRSGLE
jgi:hypothetical protein